MVNPIALTFNKAKKEKRSALLTYTVAGDYTKDEKAKSVHLTEQGHLKVEEFLINKGLIEDSGSLYEAQHVTLWYLGYQFFQKYPSRFYF